MEKKEDPKEEKGQHLFPNSLLFTRRGKQNQETKEGASLETTNLIICLQSEDPFVFTALSGGPPLNWHFLLSRRRFL